MSVAELIAELQKIGNQSVPAMIEWLEMDESGDTVTSCSEATLVSWQGNHVLIES